ncbi:hypothetical protein BKA61DRAFT_247692 [Leptodontidium sp. MPI-SDFR-AT-0119]|nr:hypothetical protein BKA61DRAFT_247692 [Leptodontidium sp. MPI-SDFR-AT-0119]
MDDKRASIIGFNITWMAISLIAISIRLLTRHFLIERVGVDDILITIGFFLAQACSSLGIWMTKYGLGLHIQYVKLASVPMFTKIMASIGLVYNLCHMFIKLSYLALYLRLTPHTRFRVILYILMVSVSVLGIINASISVVVCIPFTKVWNPEVAGRCINANAFYIATSTLNMVFDLAIFILPIPIVWEMQLPKRQRLAVEGVFGVGLIVLIASILRLYNLISLFNNPSRMKDSTWSTAGSLNLSTLEIHLALVLSCLATFKALVQKYFPHLLGSSHLTIVTPTGGSALHSHSRNEPNFNTASRENIIRDDKNGSQ